MSAGWFLMHRGWMESPDFRPEPFTEREAFAWSIEQASHAPHLQWFNGIQIPVARGEFATSSRKMAATFKWGEKRVRLFMGRMEKRQKWALRQAQQGAHVATILSVCNYERFQAPAKEKGAPKGADEGAPRTHLGRTEDAQQKEPLNNGDEGKELVPAAQARSPNLPYSEAVAIWTEHASANGWKPTKPTISDKRRSGLAKILKAHGLDGWRDALARGAASDLLCGPDPPGWFNFNFVCNPENFLKLSEGNYDKQFSNGSKQQRPNAFLAARDRVGTRGAGVVQHQGARDLEA